MRAGTVRSAIVYDAGALIAADPGDLHALLDAAKPAVRPSLIAV
ncbi:hypothetical protein [Nonomuraea dietziae]